MVYTFKCACISHTCSIGMEVCEGIVNGKKSWDDLFETLAFFTLFK